MTPQRFREIRLFFEKVVDLQPAHRSTALMNARLTDPELAAEVEALIAAYARRAGFIEQPAAALCSRNECPSEPGTTIGAYELLELIGLGGMGEVWRAEQRHPVRRLVAVKLI